MLAHRLRHWPNVKPTLVERTCVVIIIHWHFLFCTCTWLCAIRNTYMSYKYICISGAMYTQGGYIESYWYTIWIIIFTVTPSNQPMLFSTPAQHYSIIGWLSGVCWGSLHLSLMWPASSQLDLLLSHRVGILCNTDTQLDVKNQLYT